MKKLIFSALIATVLFVFSCGKDNEEEDSRSLLGTWYFVSLTVKDTDHYLANKCAQDSEVAFSETDYTHLAVSLLSNGNCDRNITNHTYTTEGNVINYVNKENNQKGRMEFHIKNNVLSLSYPSANANGKKDTYVYRRKDTHDPAVGKWFLKRVETHGKTIDASRDDCYKKGYLRIDRFRISTHFAFPNAQTGGCREIDDTRQWINIGGKYYQADDNKKATTNIAFELIDGGNTIKVTNNNERYYYKK